jgi:hypothetical protein
MYRGGVFRRITFAIILLTFIASGWWWAPPVYKRIEMLYWQHQCMSYSPQPGQVICDSKLSVKLVPYGTLFIHELRKPSGEPRLVVLDLRVVPFHGETIVVAMPHEFEPATLLHAAVEHQESRQTGILDSSSRSFKVFAGAADQADPTHFTFRVDDDGNVKKYEGWLEEDDSISIGEQKQPPPLR